MVRRHRVSEHLSILRLPAKRTLSVSKTRSSVWKPPPPPPRIKKHKRDMPQPLYVKMQNQDIFGRCDLGDEPVDFSQAETLCERDPLCKALWKSMVKHTLVLMSNDDDKSSKGGRTLYIYHTYYKDIRETPNPPNLRKSPKTNANIYTSSSSSSSSQRPSIFQWKTNHPSTTSPSSYSDVPAAHQWHLSTRRNCLHHPRDVVGPNLHPYVVFDHFCIHLLRGLALRVTTRPQGLVIISIERFHFF